MTQDPLLSALSATGEPVLQPGPWPALRVSPAQFWCLFSSSVLKLLGFMTWEGFPVLHHLSEFAQTHVHWVNDFHLSLSSSVTPFTSCLQSFPASGSFPMSRLFASAGQSTGASASVIPYSGFISFRIDLFDLLAVQGTLKSLLQHHSSKASILQHSAFFMKSNFHIHIWLLEKP